MVGNIYLAKIYFTDLSSFKIRPVLVVKELDKEDVVCLQLSTKIDINRVRINNEDLIDGRLLKESVVIVPKNFTLNKKIFVRYIGKISEEKLKEILEKAGRIQRTIVKEIDDLQNSGTLPKDLHKKMNLIKYRYRLYLEIV
jgi:mRNA interferase MazF